MDQAQARALLAGERARLQRLLQAATGEPQVAELGDDVDDADRRNADQTGMAVDQLLRARWAALQRAEARLAAGSYGRSVASGQAIQTLLAQLVILTVIPQATTEPNQTGLTRNAAQPDLARPN
jgi:DnaK suppressor protein